MNSSLTDKVKALADIENIDGLTKLLCEWPDQTSEWLIFVEIRIHAPSSNAEQKKKLKDIRQQALNKNPDLLENDFGEVLETKIASETISKEVEEDFNYTDEDLAQYEIIETLEECEDWHTNEIDDYLGSLNYLSLDDAVQHLINQSVYGLLMLPEEYQAANKIADTNVYKKWHHLYAPASVLNNSDISLQNLIDFTSIEKRVDLIERRNYYAYLIESDNEDLDTFDNFYKQTRSSNSFSNPITSSEVQRFEQAHNVVFPVQLKDLFLAVNDDQDFSILNLTELEHYLSEDRKNYEHLNGLGLVHMLDFVWSNRKDDFKPDTGSLTQTQIDFLNTHYTAIGSLAVDDNTYIIIYFDKDNRFGAVWYCQDDGIVFSDYLYPLLEKSQAQHSLYQLLVAIPMVLKNLFFEYRYQEEFVANLRMG